MWESEKAAAPAAVFIWWRVTGVLARPPSSFCLYSFKSFLLLQIHVHDILYRKPEEPGPHLPEFFRRVGGEELELRWGCDLVAIVGARSRHELQLASDFFGGRFGLIDDRDMRRRHSTQQRLNERIMSTAEQQHVGSACVVGMTNFG